MQAMQVFHKTAKGQTEIESRGGGLSLKQRRVLILVNGANSAAELSRLSLCEDIDAILQFLERGGFIDDGNQTTTSIMARDYSNA